ncbi:hephaestin [Bryocella elongata]|uniref:Hephaestin n=1 Tax=Bryocella elongata TaxID=863522 RepID=A0A1H5YN31_9BACT|nr:multicopper oxidase domain-containing protein [Bryocella elongata]SEG25569.1 hephaestin [Bryocella elongata]
MPQPRQVRLLALLLLLAASIFQAAIANAVSVRPAPGKTRTYFVAADEVQWDYTPSGRDEAMGMDFDDVGKAFTQSGPHRIGHIYKKAIYREYTDATFTTLKPRPADEAYLGLLGPILRGAVGDTIRVVFKNNATHPYSMHPHGVLYEKDSEGADYNDNTTGKDKEDGGVAPGATHTYTWQIPERSGPGPNDPSSVFWLYHSHADELSDVASGLFGVIVITRRGMARPDGRPKDVDHEFVSLYIAINENESHYLDDNIRDHTTDPKHVNKLESIPTTPGGMLGTIAGTGFFETNIKWSINGYIFGNMPMMTMKKGDHVRWYVATLGDFFNAHTPHWHGNTVLVNGQRTDVLWIGAAQMITADMVPDAPGIWLYHCHISDHMLAGMVARYQVTK